MSKTKKVTAAAIMKAMQIGEDDNTIIICDSGNGTIEIPVKSHLSIAERMSMVRDIVDMVFISDENGDIEYVPAIKEFAIGYAIVNYFTDIVLPANSDKILEFIEKTGITDRIAEMLRDGYIAEIVAAAEEMIGYRKQELLKRSKLDTILDGVIDVVKTINEKIGNIELPQILEYVQHNVPELKDTLEDIIKSQAADTSAE